MEYNDPLARRFAGEIFEALRAVAVPEDAAPMKRYMKNKFEFLGVKAPARREVLKGFRRLPEGADPEAVFAALWAYPFREAQHAAVDMAERHVKYGAESRLALYVHFIADRPWWDTVDAAASKLVGGHFVRFPHLIAPHTEAWMDSGDLWLQRTCLIFQLKYGASTDEDMLFEYIRRLRESKEFFIRKAIGWALRQHARVRPDAVRSFVEQTELSPLSRREALKHLGQK